MATPTQRNTKRVAEFLGEDVVIALRIPDHHKRSTMGALVAAAVGLTEFIPGFGIAIMAGFGVIRKLVGFGRDNEPQTQLLALTRDGGRVVVSTTSHGRIDPLGIPQRLAHNAPLRAGRTDDDYEYRWLLSVGNECFEVNAVDFKQLLKAIFVDGYDAPLIAKGFAPYYRDLQRWHSGETTYPRVHLAPLAEPP